MPLLRAGREPRWLTDTLLRTLAELHADGWAHSFEVSQRDTLVGDADPIGIGDGISGDSLFGRHQDAAPRGHGRPAAVAPRPCSTRRPWRRGVMPVTGIWVAGPVLAWAVAVRQASGRRSPPLVAVRLRPPAAQRGASPWCVNGVGAAAAGRRASSATWPGSPPSVETERQHAVEVEAASRERERLARDIHDSVLQVLALVQRRGAEAGGEAAELGRLAGEQEAALRTLVAGAPGAGPSRAGETWTCCALVLPVAVGPGDGVGAGRVRSAGRSGGRGAGRGDRARRWTTCGGTAATGTEAWVLVEDEPGLVTVTRPGRRRRASPPDRLAEAAAAGPARGQPVHPRPAAPTWAAGATISSVPGEGTEVELHLPRGPAVPVARAPGPG